MLTALCLFFFAFLSPTFWHDLITQTPIHTIAIAAVIVGIIQALKAIAPNIITGRWIVVVNTTLAIGGVLIENGTSNFWTETTWARILVFVVAAAGTHGTAKTLSGSGDDANGKPLGAAVLALFFGTAMLAGCGIRAATPPTAPTTIPAGAADATDAHANQVLQAIQAFMKPIVRDIASGKLKATPAQRTAINTLDGFYNKAIVAEQGYHACMFTPETTPAACLATSALTGALASAQGAFTAAQASLAAGVSP